MLQQMQKVVLEIRDWIRSVSSDISTLVAVCPTQRETKIAILLLNVGNKSGTKTTKKKKTKKKLSFINLSISPVLEYGHSPSTRR